MPAEPLKVVLRGDDADCAICAISMFTDMPYADVMREVLRHDRQGGSDGLTDRVIRRTMAGLGHPVRFTRKIDFEDGYGLLHLTGHVVVLKRGQVIEPTSTWCSVWDADDYVRYAAGRDMLPEGIWLCQE